MIVVYSSKVSSISVDNEPFILFRLVRILSLSFPLATGKIDFSISIINLSIIAVISRIIFERGNRKIGLRYEYFLVISGLYILICSIVPPYLGGADFVIDRFMPIFYLVFVLWIVSQDGVSRRGE